MGRQQTRPERETLWGNGGSRDQAGNRMGTGMRDFGTGRNRLADDLPGSGAVLSSRM